MPCIVDILGYNLVLPFAELPSHELPMVGSPFLCVWCGGDSLFCVKQALCDKLNCCCWPFCGGCWYGCCVSEFQCCCGGC